MIQIRTSKRVEIIDITSRVAEEVERSGIREGIAVIYTKHTTTGIVINEGESGLLKDIENMLSKLVPQNQGYIHDRIDNNADAHLRAVLLGNSAVVPVSDGRLELGTWQSILFIELDGPRNRSVVVKVIGQ
ncbi:secondary thiamine-phosphate synthase enzyme [Archaeoglobus sulfaticallidus PM70-1]|uniref:Secondary thiamine-phosphate synthase enzyme n=1 Tax=Archaeoglobus sulfaticallidus PM70-1 TaxID=387631 RepID=N0BET4_9EURY|nr:secondary thiamine-phosphate synthase enzyme YjbQ [Archaeoglobus sulfaticallidus]AGK60787.1 secondary thiamine-phosphate synthase enzyme [Archaeoglobus sulfaticallidus PM70-1]